MRESAASQPAGQRWWGGLRVRLFLSYLLVVIAGLLASGLVTSLLAPSFFANHMAQMMGPGAATPPGMGMGMGAVHAPDQALAASLQAAVNRSLIAGAAVATLAALAASMVVTARIAGPIRRLASASRQIAAGRYSARVTAEGPGELAEMAAGFNEMAGALESTERRRLELIGDVAHELRTPVATLEGYLEGLLDGVVQPGEETWARLHNEAGRLRRLIDDLQELSRAEAGQFSLHLRPLQPLPIVQTVINRLAPLFEEKGISLTLDSPGEVPTVYADPDRLDQVLSNLLTNALRYTPACGKVSIRVENLSALVHFAVADTGIGIAPEHLSHLFERFYRVDRSRSRALGGSGIGLTIAKALVEAMGGQIWAESPGPGKGATFTFQVPVAKASSLTTPTTPSS
jgi:signal transduction histidine kinase